MNVSQIEMTQKGEKSESNTSTQCYSEMYVFTMKLRQISTRNKNIGSRRLMENFLIGWFKIK